MSISLSFNSLFSNISIIYLKLSNVSVEFLFFSSILYWLVHRLAYTVSLIFLVVLHLFVLGSRFNFFDSFLGFVLVYLFLFMFCSSFWISYYILVLGYFMDSGCVEYYLLLAASSLSRLFKGFI